MEKLAFRIVQILLVVKLSTSVSSEDPLSSFLSLLANKWGQTKLKVNLSRSFLEDAFLTTDQIIHKYGYPIQTHFVTTKDGYILRLHRIPRRGGKPILLQHGFLDSSATFVITGPEVAPAYYLWQQGYDVWLGNIRGNRYSRNHTWLNPAERPFWNFTFHEMGIYDLPAMIDYILNISKHQKLTYVGHSQGTTAFFIMCSKRPDYNNKVKVMHALAPIAFIGHMDSPLIPLGIFISPLAKYIYELTLPRNIIRSLCFDQKRQEVESMCLEILFMGMGRDVKHFDMSNLPTILGHVPSSSSFKDAQHFLQMFKSDQFREFDYGENGNLQKYKQKTPPDYEVSNIRVPISLYYSASDHLSVPVDVMRLENVLGKNIVGKFEMPEGWNHMGYTWATDAREVVYDKILSINKIIDG